MRLPSASRLLGVILAALLAVTSVTAARMMTPEARGPAEAAHLHLAAFVQGELCTVDAPHEAGDHHCPFCHGLPAAPEVAWRGLVLPVEAFRTLPGLAHLLRGARDRDLSRSPRGPPVRA